jgi:hypothetical protein
LKNSSRWSLKGKDSHLVATWSALTVQFGSLRPEGEPVKFLSANTLHLIDQALWMSPFSTTTDLEEAAKLANISLDRSSVFLKTLREEHSLPEAQAQLWRL